MAELNNLLVDLIKIGVFKTGEFTLKSGVSSPIYIDLRSIIAYPNIGSKIAEKIRTKQLEKAIEMDVICGVPYTALPLASAFSFSYNTPMIIKRKEAKAYGTKKMVEGIFKAGDRCLIIEDIVSSGSSIIETVDVLKKEGLIVTDCIAVLNRKQGGSENLLKYGITLHSLFDIHQLFEKYCSMNNVDSETIKTINKYLKDNYIPVKNLPSVVNKPFDQRMTFSKQPVLTSLFNIMFLKKTNLCVSVDVIHSKDLLKIAQEVGPHICILKTHIDILVDFNDEVSSSLRKIADSFNFLIMEDRKFADIGNTAMHQYADGIYSIQKWADIVTVHAIPGSGQIEALKTVAQGNKRACVLVAEMSSKGSLTNESYQSQVIEMAKEFPEFVIGFVSQHKLTSDDNLITMTPGVNLSEEGDKLGQQYSLPVEAVEKGADIIIVGRGICKSSNISETAEIYKNKGYTAYLNKCSS